MNREMSSFWFFVCFAFLAGAMIGMSIGLSFAAR